VEHFTLLWRCAVISRRFGKHSAIDAAKIELEIIIYIFYNISSRFEAYNSLVVRSETVFLGVSST
jgi:hypothetical protein